MESIILVMSFLSACLEPTVKDEAQGELAVLPTYNRRTVPSSNTSGGGHSRHRQEPLIGNNPPSQRRMFQLDRGGMSARAALGRCLSRLALEERPGLSMERPGLSPLGYTVESPPSATVPLNSFGEYCHHYRHRRRHQPTGGNRFPLADGGGSCPCQFSENDLYRLNTRTGVGQHAVSPGLLESTTSSAHESSPRLGVINKNQPVISLKKSKSAEKVKHSHEECPPSTARSNPVPPVVNDISAPQDENAVQNNKNTETPSSSCSITVDSQLFSAMVSALNRIEIQLHEARHGGTAVEQWAKLQLERDAIELQNDHLRYLLNTSKNRADARRVVQEWLQQDGDRELLGQILFDAMTECLIDAPLKPTWAAATVMSSAPNNTGRKSPIGSYRNGLFAR